MIELPIPEEPKEIKEYVLRKVMDPKLKFMDRDSVIRLYTLTASSLPKYLWRYWKNDLKKNEITWQLFLKALSACNYDVIRWVEDNISWNELVEIIIKVINKASKGEYPLWPP